MTIKEIIQQIIDDGNEEHGIVCKVTAVNGMICECEPINGNAPILDVRLVANDSENKFLMVPKLESLVVVEFFNSTAGYVSLVSEIAELYCKIGEAWMKLDADGVTIKKGDDSLKDILKNIVDATKQIFVMYGNNPDFGKLADAMSSINNLFH
jgi:hypothetical protein